jgi:transcriptional regulator of acetoin/glycerol metabolism
VAENRVKFLTDEPVQPGGVRDAILASWWRSRHFDVAADRIALPYMRDPDLGTPLARSAEPVLRSLTEQLDGQPISVVLTDATGMVLTRLTADADLERHLDRVNLAPGFSYAEEFVGTNGIGTALEGGQPMHVFGSEHYAERLEDLACAGVPIAHPLTGKTVGALDLTCWRKDAGPLLVTLAKTTTEQIRQALLADTSMREIELLQEYLRACHRSTGIVFALNNDVVMMNDLARAVLDPSEQDALLRQVADGSPTARTTSVTDLPSGKRARIWTQPVRSHRLFAGLVAQVKLLDTDSPRSAEPGSSGSAGGMLLPGLVGAGPLWRRVCDETRAVCADGAWLALEGEAGTGKWALLRAAHQRARPSARITALDLAETPATGRWLDELRKPLRDPGTSVLLRHVDRLDGIHLRALASALQETRSAPGAGTTDAPGWVAITFDSGAKSAELTQLVELFPRTIEVPPLRHHLEDVHLLVSFFLNRLGYGGKLSCSSEVRQLFGRASWPGNVAQVLQTLREVVKHRRNGVIGIEDVPPEILTVSRRQLSQLEAIERDAIVRGLLASKDNKAEAARALGMSRATIYRKIHEYGIVPRHTS